MICLWVMTLLTVNKYFIFALWINYKHWIRATFRLQGCDKKNFCLFLFIFFPLETFY